MKIRFFLTALIALLLFSCSEYHPETETPSTPQPTKVNIHLDFTTTETSWKTRATTAAGSSATRISVAIFDESEKLVKTLAQRKDDADFGTLHDLTLLPGKYKVVVVAHYADNTESQASSISSPSSATINDKTLRDVYSTVQEITVVTNVFSAQNINIEVPIQQTKLKFLLLDEIPEDVATIKITFNSEATAHELLTFNPSTGCISSASSYTREHSIKTNRKAGQSFSVYAFLNEYPSTVDALIQALNSTGDILFQRTISGQEYKKGTTLQVSAHLFTHVTTTSLSFGTWEIEEVAIE